MTPRERWRALLWQEWQRRRDACAAAIAEAKTRGDLAAYRAALARWERFYARRHERPRAG